MADGDCAVDTGIHELNGGAQFAFESDGTTKTICFFDWKHFREKSISFDREKCHTAPSLKYWRDLANREQVPFFIGITFTKPQDGYGEGQEHPAMFCLVPGNRRAGAILKQRGTWFTPRELAKLLINLRGKTVDDNQLMHMQHVYARYKLQTEIDELSLTANWRNE